MIGPSGIGPRPALLRPPAHTPTREHLIRLSLRELLPQLDGQQFGKVHRSSDGVQTETLHIGEQAYWRTGLRFNPGDGYGLRHLPGSGCLSRLAGPVWHRT